MRRGALMAAAAAALAGCAPRAATQPVADAPPRAAPPEAAARLVNTDNGLAVRRWVISGDPQGIRSVLDEFDQGPPSPRAESLGRCGLRLAQVPAERLPSLLRSLGEAASEVVTWHGQVLQWRLIEGRPTGERGTVVATGGRVRELGPGTVRLLARSWTVQTETGPFLTLELLPEHVGPEPPTPFRKLLGREEVRGQVFEAARVSMLLEPGVACVLAGEAPQAREGGALGPRADLPMTLGEFLLTGEGSPPTHVMLVFVPLIPDRLLEPYRTAGRQEAPRDAAQ